MAVVAETVMPSDPVAVGAALLCALMVTAVAGAAAGAVYWPMVGAVLEMVPVVALPPVTPFTIHVTVWSVAPVTTAEYEYGPALPASTLAGPLTATDAATTLTAADPVAVLDSTLTAPMVTVPGAVAGGV